MCQHFTLVCTENILNEFNWTMQETDSVNKTWHKYTQAFISTGTKVLLISFRSHDVSLVKTVKYLHMILQLQYLVKKKNFSTVHNELRRYSPFGITSAKVYLPKELEDVKSLLCSCEMKRDELMYSPSHVYHSTIKWKHGFHKTLNTKVTFRKFILFGYEKMCDSFLFVASGVPLNQNLYFCGLYSDMDVFPASHKIQNSLTYNTITSFVLNVFFDIMGKDIIDTVHHDSLFKTMVLLNENTQKYKLHQIKIFFTNEIFSSFHLVIEKHKAVILILSKGNDNRNSIVYDGPGFLCSKLSLNKTPVECSSFQCLLLLRHQKAVTETMKIHFDERDQEHQKTFTVGSKTGNWS